MQDHSLSESNTYAVATLGCKVNQADSEAISEQMSAAGFEQRDFSDAADVYIVNTCTVTHLGDRSSRQMIAQANRRHPDALLVVTGCYAELNPKAVAALPGVDLVVGNSDKDKLIETIQEKIRVSTPIQEKSSDQELSLSRPMLPVLSLDTQHIGSDGALAFQSAEDEPQPDNPSRLSPFTDPTQSAEQVNRSIFSRTRVQMKVQ